MVQASLRTKDNSEAKQRHAVADAALRRFWDAQRKGPARLTQKQAAALAGTLYHDLSAAFEDQPGSPETWAWVQDVNERAREGRFGEWARLLIGAKARNARSLEDRFGGFADALLAREGLVVDEESRGVLIKAIAEATDAAARRLERNALFDYTPDPAANRFPEWESISTDKPNHGHQERLTVSALFDRWQEYQADKLAENTIKRYGASLKSLAAFMNKDAGAITADDLYAWAQHRRDKEGVSPTSINKNDLVAVSSVFKWAASRKGGRIVPGNPVTKDIHLDEPRVTPTRARNFRPEEVAAILKAALAVPHDPENPTSAFARRWTPWLAAYSGARITELTRLERADIREEGGTWTMTFRKTKTNVPRTVPIHDHLIAQGFLDFIRARKAGPLFYDPNRHEPKAKTHPAEQRSRKLADWVREATALDMAVDPNHGWRHTFKTRALDAGMPERISDAITGHVTTSVARGYETPSVDMMAKWLNKVPRYDVR
jgi:integrase